MGVAAITAASGKNGVIYISGAELPGANSWSIDVSHDNIEYAVLNDTWVSQLNGLLHWSGSLGAVLDTGAKQILDAAVAAGVVALLIYPSLVTTSYHSGNAIFSFGSSADMSSAVSETASFVGSGALTTVGFA